MNRLSGKKLLILGAGNDELYLLNEAHKRGMSVVVTDFYTDWSRSPAKYVADEAWDISWSDMDTLVEKCKAANIDGIFAGYSEEKVLQASKLCSLLGLPFYASTEQVEATRDKLQFKELCRKCGIGTTPEYQIDLTFPEDRWNVPEYPVIVKPVDNGGARGISVCNNQEELVKGIKYALEFSKSKQVIIEKFLTCTSMDAVFYVQKGEPLLIFTRDKTLYKDPIGGSPQPTSHTFPSLHQKLVEENLTPGVKKLIKHLSIQNGTLFIQIFTDGKELYVFEMGFRMNGGYDQIFAKEEYGIDVLDCYYNHSIFGTFGDKPLANMLHPLKHIYVVLSFPIKNGLIGEIKGFDNMSKLPKVLFYMQSYHEGDRVSAAGTYAQLFGKFFLKADTIQEMKDLIYVIKQTVDVLDCDGQSMIADMFDENILDAYADSVGKQV